MVGEEIAATLSSAQFCDVVSKLITDFFDVGFNFTSMSNYSSYGGGHDLWKKR